MGYTAEVIRRARRQLERNNAEQKSQQLARQAQAYAKVPRLKEIDIQLQHTMAAAAKAAFESGNVQDAMAAIRRENEALQRERAELVKTSFPESFRLEDPLCPICGGSGYVGAHMCQCLDALCRQEQVREADRLGDGTQYFDNFRLDYYPQAMDPRAGVSPRLIMEKNLNTCRQYTQTFAQNMGNLLFNGTTGLGKTFLALCVAREVACQGFTVCYETAISLFSKLEKAHFTPNEENLAAAQELKQCDLLIIDDLGTEMPGQFVTSALYGLLNGRLLDKKAMLVTTNLNVHEAGARYSQQIASRLYGEFLLLPFLGSDIRVLKRQRGYHG